MKNMHTMAYNLAQIPKVASEIISMMDEYALFTFYGEVGAGKTTLIKEICKQLGVIQDSSSPTFSLVNEYETKNGKIYHIDLYRLKNMDEALEIGIDEYLYSGDPCFIEWPQCIEGLIFDENVMAIEITTPDNTRRHISWKPFEVEED